MNERERFVYRCLHGDTCEAPLGEAPPNLRARAAALERALPHVNYCVTWSRWFVKGRRLRRSSAATVLAAQPFAFNDAEVERMLPELNAPVEEPLRPLLAAFAVELFRRHKHVIDLVMPHETARQYDNLCSLMFVLVTTPPNQRDGLIPGLDEEHRATEPTPS
jgi:hypothetical protein